jgi:membrane associated rhomboid family serine protease
VSDQGRTTRYIYAAGSLVEADLGSRYNYLYFFIGILIVGAIGGGLYVGTYVVSACFSK